MPFRKRDAECIRNISELRASDKGGMIFQPEPGVYEKVHQIDFTSLYPSIIVKYNLSPETIEHPKRRRVSRLNYSRRCAEASAVQAHVKQGIPLASGMEIGYVIRDARKWEVDPERTAAKFDAACYRGLLEKAWEEAAFVFTLQKPILSHLILELI